MNKKLMLSLICSILLLITLQIKVNADSPAYNVEDVFTNEFFQDGSYTNQINSGKGGSKFTDYDNNIRNVSMGIDQNEKYIELTYGSKGSKGGNDRYVNFQMEFNNKLRNNNNMIDGSKTKIYHNLEKENSRTKPVLLSSMHQYNNNNDGQKVYSYSFDFKNYHSGSITLRIYFKNDAKERNFSYGSKEPLIYLYYKSGDKKYDKDNNFKSEFHIFETAQTFYYDDLVNAMINRIQKERTDFQSVVENSTLLDDYKNQLSNKINKTTLFTKRKNPIYLSYPRITSINQILQVIDTQENIISSLQKITLLKINDVPNLNFQTKNSNDNSTNLSKSIKLQISKFNIQDFHISLSLSPLVNKNNALFGQTFYIENKLVNPNVTFNYFNKQSTNNSTGYYQMPNIKLNFQPYTAPSGNYKGTATWNLVDGP
ncbi:hypothetical protein [Apilactobacillus timberlakei]|uniref:hypothetical protein n=1 Tax=Apilactobacillus timberlakei TaxID=2008380 RepID=UPI00112EB9CA|nr:hypothetical protein [Apilactobacillus timberlakei]TPR19379.1 hypothetical protein DYZ95_01820 [Apilactobacillus timberlakei]